MFAPVDEARLGPHQAANQLETHIVDHTGGDGLGEHRIGECRSQHEHKGDREKW